MSDWTGTATTPSIASTGSYVSIAELEAYIGSDPRASAIALKAASADTQIWYCQRATKIIDALPLRGRKYERDGSQSLQFPREYMTPDGWYPERDEEDGTVEVPQKVKDACCEEAISLYEYYSDTDNVDRANLMAQGVVSYNLGGVYSETLNTSIAKRTLGLKSPAAFDLLSKYIARSFNIV